MTMGDRIVVLKDGVVQQIAPPLELYNHPANRFVAGFIGSPAMNFIEGGVDPISGLFESDAFSIPLPITEATDEVSLGIRPEDVYVATTAPSDRSMSAPFTLPLEVTEPMGNEVFVYAGIGEEQFVARLEPQTLPEPGEPIELVVDLGKIHVFDAKSGASLARKVPI
jgi:multiple sugar transport system ATP-binding protein